MRLHAWARQFRYAGWIGAQVFIGRLEVFAGQSIVVTPLELRFEQLVFTTHRRNPSGLLGHAAIELDLSVAGRRLPEFARCPVQRHVVLVIVDAKDFHRDGWTDVLSRRDSE